MAKKKLTLAERKHLNCKRKPAVIWLVVIFAVPSSAVAYAALQHGFSGALVVAMVMFWAVAFPLLFWADEQDRRRRHNQPMATEKQFRKWFGVKAAD